MNPGYHNFMSGFVKTAAIKGWDNAVREANLLEKVAQKDAFFEGKKDALEFINELDMNDSIRGWFDFIKEANDSNDIVKVCREAQEIDDESEYWQGYKQASEEASLGKSLDELRDRILIGEPNKMSNFDNGKFAAFNDLVKIASSGEAGLAELHDIVAETLGAPLEKNASADDADYKLGVEALCHSFLKEAGEVYGTYDLSDADEADVIDFILEKVAEEEDEKEKKKMSTGAKVGLGAGALAALGAAGTAGVARKGGGRAAYSMLRSKDYRGTGGIGSQMGNSDALSRRGAASEVLRSGARNIKNALADRKAKRSNKEASEQLDNEVLDALEALDRHGLLDELLGDED